MTSHSSSGSQGYRSAGTRRRSALLCAVASVIVLVAPTRAARAACDAIPVSTQPFPGAIGSASQPFASPGDTVTVRGDACTPADDPLEDAAHSVVVVLYRSLAGDRNAVLLADDCAGLVEQVDACGTVDRVTCRSTATGLATGSDAAGPWLKFDFPPASGVDVLSGAMVPLSGPATIAVVRRDAGIPCALTQASCAELIGTAGLPVCVDELLREPRCPGAAAPSLQARDATFGQFTALPVPVSYAALASGASDEIQLAVDADGNLLLPIDWTGIRSGPSLASIVQGKTGLTAFVDSSAPLHVPDEGFLEAFSLRGARLPPVFAPLLQGEPVPLGFLGVADAPRSVLRVASRSVDPAWCVAAGAATRTPCGAAATACAPGTACKAVCHHRDVPLTPEVACGGDADCPSDAQCGPLLFDLSTRVLGGIGPVLLSRASCSGGAATACAAGSSELAPTCDCFTVEPADPIEIDAILLSDELMAVVRAEAAAVASSAAVDNGDGDLTDEVVTVRGVERGDRIPIGVHRTAGRAIARAWQGHVMAPAMDLEGDVLAFLEPEATQDRAELHPNGSLRTRLRVLQLNKKKTKLRSRLPAIASSPAGELADAEPVIDGRSVAVSRLGGRTRVFFRTAERAAGERTTRFVSRAFHTTHSAPVNGAAISRDGTTIAFERDEPSDVVPAAERLISRVYVRDLASGTEHAVTDGSTIANVPSHSPAISGDGRVVAFSSAGNDVYVAAGGVLTRASQTKDGSPPGGLVSGAHSPAVSGDGKLVTFASGAENLLAREDTFKGFESLYLFDPLANVQTRLHTALETWWQLSDGQPAAMSADARFLAFGVLSYGGPNNVGWVHDRRDESLTIAASSSAGRRPNGPNWGPLSISDDGRFVGFATLATNLARIRPAEPRRLIAVVRDRLLGQTRLASASADGTAVNAAVLAARMASDGRAFAFSTRSSNLVPGDTNGTEDVFVRDLVTGLVERVSAGLPENGGRELDGDARLASLSAAARSIVFRSAAPSLPDSQGGEWASWYVSTAEPALDLTGDGDDDDTVLRVLDVKRRAIATLCAATRGSVAAGRVAFLRPASDGETPGCEPLDPSGDASVAQVYLEDGSGRARNTHLTATSVLLSETWLAALAPRDQAALQPGDQDSGALFVRPLGGISGWRQVRWSDGRELIASAARIAGSLVAFVASESANERDANADGDRDDYVLHLYDAETGALVSLGEQAEDFALSSTLLAFRTREAAQRRGGIADLNGDGDVFDRVMRLYDVGRRSCIAQNHPAGCLLDTRQAAATCEFAACNARFPYVIDRDEVRFLTFEEEQGADLNGDGVANDLVVQVAKFAEHATTVVGGVELERECTDGTCDVKSAQRPALRRLEAALAGSPGSSARWSAGAAPGSFVGPSLAVAGPRCLEQVPSSLCIDPLYCTLDVGPCSAQGSCPAGSTCASSDPLTSDDGDDDCAPNGLDNCPLLANPDQRDSDYDLAGDLCDPTPCTDDPSAPCPGGEDSCTCPPPPLCLKSSEMHGGELVLSHLRYPAGKQKISLSGSLRLPTVPGFPEASALALESGMQIRIEDLSSGSARTILDLTGATVAIPGRGIAGCDERDGWTVGDADRTYANVSGRLRNPRTGDCEAQLFTGLNVRAAGATFRVSVSGIDLVSAVNDQRQLTGPYRVTVVFGDERFGSGAFLDDPWPPGAQPQPWCAKDPGLDLPAFPPYLRIGHCGVLDANRQACGRKGEGTLVCRGNS